MGVKRTVRSELRHLEAILRICNKNAPDMLQEQRQRISNEIKALKKNLAKKIKSRKAKQNV
jgi:hypothetical protein